jgi:transcription elongation factor Elf1
MTDPNSPEVIESELQCPSCGAANRPLTSYCVWDREAGTVFCLVCSHDGQLSTFRVKPLPEGEY